MGERQRTREDLEAEIVLWKRRVAELEATRASDERFRRLVLDAHDIIAVADESCALTHVSGALGRILGYEARELLGTSGLDLVHPADMNRARARFAEILRRPGSARRLEFRCRHSDGRYVWLEAVGANRIDDEPLGAVVIHLRDVTERKSAEEVRKALEEQLQQAMKMEAVGRLAGGVAHDFNNLLTTIAGNIELVRMELGPSDPSSQHLDQVSRAAESATSLTRQLLAFSRRQLIEPQILDLNDLVGGIQGMLARMIGEDVSLIFAPSSDLGLVKADPGQLEQVLVNLAVNARDAMPAGGRLKIETANVEIDADYCASRPYATPGPFVRLRVSDTGHGMPDDVKRHLFEPFFTTKPKGRGTGLGLATIFGIVKQAGGTIEAESKVGRGTTFTIYLPRASGPAARLSKTGPATELPTGRETVLLVEDDAAVRGLTVEILTRLGYEVLFAADGGEALLLVEERGAPVDLLLTDVVMPGMNGRELAERLRELHPETKVLFSSGYAEDVVLRHGALDRRLDFIAKPFTMQALAEKVRAVLDRE